MTGCDMYMLMSLHRSCRAHNQSTGRAQVQVFSCAMCSTASPARALPAAWQPIFIAESPLPALLAAQYRAGNAIFCSVRPCIKIRQYL
jgi:hypothetical protein